LVNDLVNEAFVASLKQGRAMLVFAQVVPYGSFAEAARKVGLLRSVVSYHVKRLEVQLDMQ
jgi:DNA-binding transcriptional LysR family regulator